MIKTRIEQINRHSQNFRLNSHISSPPIPQQSNTTQSTYLADALALDAVLDRGLIGLGIVAEVAVTAGGTYC